MLYGSIWPDKSNSHTGNCWLLLSNLSIVECNARSLASHDDVLSYLLDNFKSNHLLRHMPPTVFASCSCSMHCLNFSSISTSTDRRNATCCQS